MRVASVCIAVSLWALACDSARDAQKRAARERFLKGTAAAPVETAAPVDVARARRDPVELEKALLVGAGAVAERLGSFRVEGTSEYRATRGRKSVVLAERLLWRQSKDGGFHTRVENNRGHGLETWWAGRKFYLRRRHGQVRERPVEGREYLKYRDDVWGALSAVYRLFGGRLRFSETGTPSVAGRSAVRFAIGLADAPLTRIAETMRPPPEVLDLGDLKVRTAERRPWRRGARPVAAAGSLDLDLETAVPLGIDLRGTLAIPDPEEEVMLRVSLRLRVGGVGTTAVRPPDGASPEPVMRKVESRRFDLIDMVRIEDFLIDKWEFPNEKGAMPRTGVSWRQARDACRQVGKRLCTFKEWQKACNSDKRRNRYPYGRIYRSDRCNTEGDGPRRAGERRDCKGEFDVFDLTGNVGEWVETRKRDRPEWCVAGGAFDDKDQARCTRCIGRDRIGRPDERVGFRCCR